jgi:hypothetical protein
MAVTAYFQPKFQLNHLKSGKANLATDTLKAGLIKSTSPALAARGTSENYEFVSDLLANNGSAMTEENGAGYARLSLTSVTYTQAALVVTLTAANLVWASMTGGTVSGTSTSLTLTVNGSGLVTWTAAQ